MAYGYSWSLELLAKSMHGRGALLPLPMYALNLDGGPVPLGFTAAYELIEIEKSLWREVEAP